MSNQFFRSKGQGRSWASQKTPEQRTIDGIVFNSELEMISYKLICPLVDPEFLSLQPKFVLLPKFTIETRGIKENVRAKTWSADFMIGPRRTSDTDPVDDRHMVIDIKGMPTPQFVVTLKFFKWSYRHIPLIINPSSKARKRELVEMVYKHCEKHGYLSGSRITVD